MDRKKPRGRLSHAQIEIMNVLWHRGEATVTEVWNELSTRRPIARNTVQTMLTRLEGRGWLQHAAKGNHFLYSPTVPRASAVREIVTTLVDSAFAGSAERMVMALLDGRSFTPAEAERIRKMIAAATRGKKE